MAVILDRPRHNNSQRRRQFPLRSPLVSLGFVLGNLRHRTVRQR
jgi:hypothetical protein